MKMKVFHADTMHDAIRAIKDELGPDALILSTKRVRRGSLPFSLFGRPLLEVTAAIDESADHAMPVQQTVPAITQDEARSSESQREQAPAFQDTLSALLHYNKNMPSESGGTNVRIPPATPKPESRPASQRCLRNLKNELLDLQQLLTSSLPDESQTAGSGFPAPLARACRLLVAQGLRSSTAERLCLALRRDLSPEALQSDRELQDASVWNRFESADPCWMRRMITRSLCLSDRAGQARLQPSQSLRPTIGFKKTDRLL